MPIWDPKIPVPVLPTGNEYTPRQPFLSFLDCERVVEHPRPECHCHPRQNLMYLWARRPDKTLTFSHSIIIVTKTGNLDIKRDTVTSFSTSSSNLSSLI
jgi:hypothetical protein